MEKVIHVGEGTFNSEGKAADTGVTLFEVLDLVSKLDITYRKNSELDTENRPFLPENRPVFINPKPGTTIPQNAVIVATSYPFGSHRCVRAMWIEYSSSSTGGFRTVTSTTTKSLLGWNAAKKGTYTATYAYGFSYGEDGYPCIETVHVNDHSVDSRWYAKEVMAGRENIISNLENFLQKVHLVEKCHKLALQRLNKIKFQIEIINLENEILACESAEAAIEMLKGRENLPVALENAIAWAEKRFSAKV